MELPQSKNISKIYEKIMHNQMNDSLQMKSLNISVFRKGFGTRHCLLLMIEKLRKNRNKGVFAAVFTAISKAFHCISHANC